MGFLGKFTVGLAATLCLFTLNARAERPAAQQEEVFEAREYSGRAIDEIVDSLSSTVDMAGPLMASCAKDVQLSLKQCPRPSQFAYSDMEPKITFRQGGDDSVLFLKEVDLSSGVVSRLIVGQNGKGAGGDYYQYKAGARSKGEGFMFYYADGYARARRAAQDIYDLAYLAQQAAPGEQKSAARSLAPSPAQPPGKEVAVANDNVPAAEPSETIEVQPLPGSKPRDNGPPRAAPSSKQASASKPKASDSVFTSKQSLILADGTKYQGGLKNGVPQGQGVMHDPSGASYQGSFENGVPDGAGTFVDAEGARYVGDFAHGSPEGRGILTKPDGSQFSGVWKEGKLVQQDVLKVPEGVLASAPVPQKKLALETPMPARVAPPVVTGSMVRLTSPAPAAVTSSQPTGGIVDRIRTLKQLLDEQLISPQEYERRKAAILDTL